MRTKFSRQERVSKTVSFSFWRITLVHKETGVTLMQYPQFLVRASTWQEAVTKVEKGLDREEWPPILELQPQIVEWGEFNDVDVAWL
jgi:hypothetical protein